jgi:hypothetical protein
MPEKEELVQICHFNEQLKPRPIDCGNGFVARPEPGEAIRGTNTDYEGLMVFNLPKKMAGFMVTQNRNRYRYIGKEPIHVKVRSTDGGQRWETVMPWRRDKVTEQTGVDENKKPTYKTEKVWFPPAKPEPDKKAVK